MKTLNLHGGGGRNVAWVKIAKRPEKVDYPRLSATITFLGFVEFVLLDDDRADTRFSPKSF